VSGKLTKAQIEEVTRYIVIDCRGLALHEYIVGLAERLQYIPEPAIPPGIQVTIMGQTFTRKQADLIIDLVNQCVPPEGK
jgi:hypothetical protein